LLIGGTFKGKGNLDIKEHKGNADWNVYNNPTAFDTVLKSGLNITLVPYEISRITQLRVNGTLSKGLLFVKIFFFFFFIILFVITGIKNQKQRHWN
jgi:hypothetical protein